MSLTTNYKTKKKVGAIITMSCLSAVAIALGAGLGVYLHNLTAPKTTYTAVEQNNDNSALLVTYGKVTSSSDLPDFTSLVKSKVFSYSDIANISLMLLSEHDNYMTQGKGAAVAAGVTQVIRDTVIRSGDRYMEESNSNSSIVHLASRAYQTADGVKLYKGSVVGGNAEVGFYSDNHTDFTKETYFAAYGRTLDTPLIYIISKATVNPASTTTSGDPATSFTKTDDGYTLELELAPNGSTKNYAVQMTTISDLKSLSFNYVHLTFYLNEKLELRSLKSHEQYVVTLNAIPLPTTTEGHLRTEFQWDQNFAIPDLATPIVYRTGD
jgi:hypothetical protein